jgi:tetratricopeptide (TPR) repeat protein
METRKLRTTRWIITVLAGGLMCGLPLHGQSPSSTRKVAAKPPETSAAEKLLIEKARLLDARGQNDLATQNWRQVLLSDPTNTEALAGVAKDEMLAGKATESKVYLDRLRTADPTDPRIAQIESMQKVRTETPQLQRAGKLAESGQFSQSMALYRQSYGNNPPPGDIALAYYETEASTKNQADYDQAVAGLRAMAKKYPNDPRYEISLGRILTYNPKTYGEGIAILERHPKDPQATEALRQALSWNASNPAYEGAIRNFLRNHPDKDLQSRLSETESKQARITGDYAKTAEERAAYDALRRNDVPLAEQRFLAIKAKQPNNPRALTGLGFVSMKKNDFGTAISYFEAAKANGAKGAALETALKTSNFWFVMSEGTAALNQNQLDVAIAQFRKALDMRPSSPEALNGLGGTLLRAQQPAEAAQVYAHLTKVDASSVEGWRGLFTAEYMMGDAPAALSTVQRLPAPVRAKLASDPEYLTNLAAAYNAVGDQSDSQRVLAQAMELPFPDNGAKMPKDRQLQFADLFMQAKRYDQASGLFRQVIAEDPNNAVAYQGLVRAEHAVGNDSAALTAVEQMPPSVLTVSEGDPGFLATIAAIYQSQGKLDIAQKLLEQAVSESTAGGHPPSVNVQLELAGIYAQSGNDQAAFAIYQQILTADPDRIDAWKGLLSALHASDRNRDALAELTQIPGAVSVQLYRDPQFLQILASIYSDAGNQSAALTTIRQAALRYQQTGGQQPPFGFAIQYCYLLLNANDDQGLYVQLMQLGSRNDLTADQRSQVQTVWAVWSVRRAAAASKHGNYQRAVQILDAANRAFPDNIDVQKALAGGYQQAGDAKRAEAIYLQMDWTNAKPADYRAAIGSALVAHDMKQAQTWLDSALKQYPNDPSILQEAAEFEQARGDNNRAAEYYKASLDAMGPADPAQSLLSDMKNRPEQPTGMMQQTNPSQDLINMLAPGTDAISTAPVPLYDMAPMQPSGNYLPGQAPVPVQVNPNGMPVAPVAGSQPMYAPRKSKAMQQPQNVERLGDYTPPQSSLTPSDLCALNRMAGVACDSAAPAAQGWSVKAVVWYAPQNAQQDTEVHVAPHSRLRLVPTSSTPVTATAPVAKAKPVAANSAPVTAAPVQVAQVLQPAQPSLHMHLRMPGSATTAPATETTATAALAAAVQQGRPVEEVPGIRYAPNSTDTTYRKAQYQTVAPSYAAPSQPAVQQSQVTTPAQPYSAGPAPSTSVETGPKGYGTYSQSAGQPYSPSYGPGYSDYSDRAAPIQQQPYYARNLPPLTGAYQQTMPRGGLQTQRDQVAEQLAALQGGYSPWVGGSAYVSYRSGQAGFDRFVVFSTPLEASAMISDTVRATIIAKPVFIDSGTPVASPNFAQGTLPFGVAPATQTASGTGGELQLRSANYGGSIGYTPYGFVVGNFIGSVYAKPNGGPFTLSFTRDSITDTQLSYSGLHDTGNMAGGEPIWGGVVANSGEIQYATTTDHSGYYVQGGGQYITGKNVENNGQANGDAGAYWRVATVPEYGSFTVGMNIFAMHYNHNLRYFTFGQGGYFSPDAYLLANIPVTFDGHYGRNFHYKINGSLGVQAFQEDASPYFPLLNSSSSCTSTSTNCYPTKSSVSGNYLIDAEAAYRMSEHWFVGGFVNANNSRDYNTATVGFYVRYMFRAQFPTEDGPPTGIFPVNGLRPVTVP